jgi:hypothetical protein
MKRLGYVGNIHHRGNTDDDEEFNRKYASERTLSEKYGKTKQQTDEKTHFFTISLWVIGLVVTFAVFNSSKIGRENIKRVMIGMLNEILKFKIFENT